MPTAKRTRPRKSTKKKSTKKTGDIDSLVEELYLPDGETLSPSESLNDYILLIYGESGIGKTSLVTQFPGLYLLQCDPNRKGLSVRQTNIPDMSIADLRKQKPKVTPWQLIDAMIEKIVDDDSVATVGIDNFGMLYEHALRDVCYRQMINDPGEPNDYGQTWRKISDNMTTSLNRILAAGKGCVFITHSKVKTVKVGNGDEIEMIEPTLMAGAFKWIKAVTDFAFYMDYGDSGDRILRLRGDSEIWTKCCVDPQVPHFHDPDGEPVSQISMGGSPQEAFENLMKSWNNEIRDIDYRPPGQKKSKTRRGRSKRKITE